MQVTVFGASGKVGRLVVVQLLANGHNVHVFVHRSAPFEPHERLTVVKGDIHNQASIKAALRGSEAVLSTLGSWHTPTKDILSAAMQSVIPAMQQAGIGRIVSLTGSGAWAPRDVISRANKVSHDVFGIIAKKIIADAEEHIRLLDASNLDWTVIRSPIMRRGTSKTYQLNDKLPGAIELIPRAAVAQAMVDQLADTTFLHQAPQVHRA